MAIFGRSFPFPHILRRASVFLSLTPAVVGAVWTVPAQTLSPSAVPLTPAAVSATWGVPAQALDGINSAPLAPSVVTAGWVTPLQDVSGSGPVGLTPIAIPLQWSVLPQTLSGAGSTAFTPSTVLATWVIPTDHSVDIVFGGGSNPIVINPSAVAGIWSKPGQLVKGSGSAPVTPSARALAWTIPLQTVSGNNQATLTPASVCPLWTVLDPALTTALQTMAPVAVPAFWTTPVQALTTAKRPSEVAGIVYLLRHAGLGLAISPQPLPVDATLAYMTVQEVTAKGLESLGGPSGLKQSLMQVNIFHQDYETAWNIRERVRSLIVATTGDVGNGRVIEAANHGAGYGAADVELYDAARRMHQLITRVLVWWVI